MDSGRQTPDERSLPGDAIVVHQAHAERSLSEDQIRNVVACVVEGEGFGINAISIVLADHQTVRELNRDWLGHDYETDVVSFPLDDAALAGRRVDGEVYVDLDTAAERAPEFDASFEHEALRYIIHGLLHLMGRDDSTEEQRTEMRALENRYLLASTS